MSGVAPLLSGRPVLHWELVRLARARWPRVILYGYAIWVLIEFPLLQSHRQPIHAPNQYAFTGSAFVERPLTELERLGYEAHIHADFAGRVIGVLLWQQLLLLAVLVPAATAGALGHEKERDTLAALFGTQLTGVEIVADKLLARLAVLVQPIGLTLPVIAALAVWSEQPLVRLGLAVVATALFTYALAGAAMLVSVWTRRTADAMLGCYAAYVIFVLGLFVFLGETPVPGWLDPFEIQRDLLNPETPPRPRRLAMHLAAFAAAGTGCLALAAAGLRRAGLRQAEQRPGRWLWAFRRPIGDEPVRWRERHVLGLAPVQQLRAIPTGLALTGTFAFAGVLVYSALDSSVARTLFPSLWAGQWAAVARVFREASPERVFSEVTAMGVILVGLAAIVVGVRSAGCVAEEKRRKTWEDLVLTPLTAREIMTGKRRGILDASLPHLAAYSLPMLVLASFGGPGEIVAAVLWIGGTVLVMAGVSAFAIGNLPEDDRYAAPRRPQYISVS